MFEFAAYDATQIAWRRDRSQREIRMRLTRDTARGNT